MHSIPPLVTVSSSGAGRRPWRCSWRSSRYSRTLGMPSLGAYCSAIPGSSRSSRATIWSRSAVGNVSGFGKPPDIESAPGGGPARIVASSAAPRSRARRANSNVEAKCALLSTVEALGVLRPVRQLVQRAAARARLLEDRAPRARAPLLGLPGRRDPVRRRDHQAVVVAEDDVAGPHADPREAHRHAEPGARNGRARARERAARVGRQAEPPQPGDVAVEGVGEDVWEPAPGRVG